ncbi:MAG TPA: protein translocase subunit SecD [Candidatus Cloacimonadota bacterium]|nr:protein translocase subunit SecD [Candidatus Cloacimonadota bacterium]
MRNISWRSASIFIFVLATLFFLAPMFIPGLPGWWGEKKIKLGLDLRGGMQILLDVDTSKLSAADAKDAVDNAIEVIRSRVDQFGVSEPTIQRIGEKRIMVQLPGVKDFDRARNLIGKTAMLEFKFVAEQNEAEKVITALDNYLANNVQKYPALADIYKPLKTAERDSAKADSLSFSGRDKIFSSLINSGSSGFTVGYEDADILEAMIKDTTFTNNIPAGYQIALGQENKKDPKADRDVYILHSNTELTGEYIDNAKVNIGNPNSGDPSTANKPYISFKLNREGARRFEVLTGNNINKRLAILLDGVVYAAPVIKDRIPRGEGQISGNFTLDEVRDLVIVLRTGNLKAPITEERTMIVGPSLGADSIKSGMMSSLIGLIIVLLFVVILYKGAGVIADIALLLNAAFIGAMLAAFGAALTLPGIAGAILSVAMAVDANVLIYERIKEELNNGKTPRSAVDAGFKRATVTIWDSQLTTLIAAVVLYNMGSGPVRGFAVTLTIGIIGSMFTAIVVCRAMFDAFVLKSNKTKISI